MPAARTHRLRPRAPPGAGARRRPPQRDRGRGRTRRRGGTRSGRLGVSAWETGAAALGPSPVPPGPRAARGLGDPRPAVSQTGSQRARPAALERAARSRPCPVRRHLPLSRDPRRHVVLRGSRSRRRRVVSQRRGLGARAWPLAASGDPAGRGRRATWARRASLLPHPEGPGARPRPGLRTDAARVSRRSERCRVTLSRRESLRRRFFPPAAQQVTQFTSRSLEEGPPLAMSSGPGPGWSPWPPVALPRAPLGGSSSQGPAQGSPRTCSPVSWSLCHCVAGCRARGSFRDVVAECLLGPEVAATRAHLLGTHGCPWRRSSPPEGSDRPVAWDWARHGHRRHRAGSVLDRHCPGCCEPVGSAKRARSVGARERPAVPRAPTSCPGGSAVGARTRAGSGARGFVSRVRLCLAPGTGGASAGPGPAALGA